MTDAAARIVTITGHRPAELGGYKTPNPLYAVVINELVKAFELLKPDYVLTGMALGVDQWAAELCLNMSIPFVAAIPFENQDSMWPPHSKAKYQWLLQHAYQRQIICQGGFEAWKMQRRNEWMIDSCGHVVAVWNGSPGGTANCVAYAMKQGKPIYYCTLPPAGMDLTAKGPAAAQLSFPGTNPTNKPAEPPPGGSKRLIDL
jgi:uncharacterized phage-like protein YoqJ